LADSGEELLRAALECIGSRWRGTGYRFVAVDAGTQATVWHGLPGGPRLPEVALRLTAKPAELVARIGRLLEAVTGVECPATLAVGELSAPDARRTVQVCSWIGSGPAGRGDPHQVGRALALLHQGMARSAVDLSDRPLLFAAEPPAGSAGAAREWWRDRVQLVLGQDRRLPTQPVHGDMHWDNIVAGRRGGFGFIDFDKVMLAPPAFDLAKLLATGFFRIEGGAAYFDRAGAARLLTGYLAERPLEHTGATALEGYAILVNEQTSILGDQLGLPEYRRQAAAVGAWWTDPARDREDPLGVRAAAQTA
jgi:Phosphotransferase enzyme family